MPIPKPAGDETQKEFIDRCMGNPNMQEYKPPQREAICQRQWREKDKQSMTSMRGSYLWQFIYSTPWAILPDKFAQICAVVERYTLGVELPAAEVSEIMAARPQARASSGAVAVIPVLGTIIPRGDSLAESSGAVSATRIGAMFNQAMSDPGVSSIVLDINSPGGSAAGIEELAQQIYQSRGGKPIVAVANHLAASAAYWIATAADEIVVSPSAQVGSIGVFAAHQDNSAALDRAGVKVTLISAGKYKTEGNPYQPLSDEALAYAQESVNTMYGMFVKAVARGRGVGVADVRDGFGQGRMVDAKQAVAMGMADRVETMDECMARMMKGKKMPMDMGASDDTDLRRRRLRLAEKGFPGSIEP